MNNVGREDILALAVRAGRYGQKNLARNLYVVAELMSDSGDRYTRCISEIWKETIESIADDGVYRVAKLADASSDRANALGIGMAVGMVS